MDKSASPCESLLCSQQHPRSEGERGQASSQSVRRPTQATGSASSLCCVSDGDSKFRGDASRRGGDCNGAHKALTVSTTYIYSSVTMGIVITLCVRTRQVTATQT